MLQFLRRVGWHGYNREGRTSTVRDKKGLTWTKNSVHLKLKSDRLQHPGALASRQVPTREIAMVVWVLASPSVIPKCPIGSLLHPMTANGLLPPSFPVLTAISLCFRLTYSRKPDSLSCAFCIWWFSFGNDRRLFFVSFWWLQLQKEEGTMWCSVEGKD